jgi:hypothetical protein
MAQAKHSEAPQAIAASSASFASEIELDEIVVEAPTPIGLGVCEQLSNDHLMTPSKERTLDIVSFESSQNKLVPGNLALSFNSSSTSIEPIEP